MMHTTTQNKLEEIDRELMDPEQWDDEPVTLVASPNRTLTIGLRLSRDELRILSAGSDAANLMLSDYIKRAAIAATKAGLDIE
jgi:hypothetical protein